MLAARLETVVLAGEVGTPHISLRLHCAVAAVGYAIVAFANCAWVAPTAVLPNMELNQMGIIPVLSRFAA